MKIPFYYKILLFYFVAPNVYKIPTVVGSSKEGPIRSAPAFSMTNRRRPSLPPTIFVPGPGTYEADYELLKRKQPVYSIGMRHKVISDDHLKPGPGAHCPEKVYSFIFSFNPIKVLIFFRLM